MNSPFSFVDANAIFGALSTRGPSSSPELQRAIGKSQATVSRAVASLGSRVVTLGQGRATRYGVPKPINGAAAQQTLWWIDTLGNSRRWGVLTFLDGDFVHVAAKGIDVMSRGRLPWFLSPLKPQGFLGREWAARLDLDGDPARWTLEQTLHAALRIADPTGAISLGEPTGDALPPAPADLAARSLHYDALAADVSATLPAGSSAGGEQSKFLSSIETGERVLVKFTPPRGTPFGERWHDLLHAEALALRVLGEHGVPVAATVMLESSTRTYLQSTRFDRMGPRGLGRRHVVSLDSVRNEFTPGSRQNWAATCDSLALQRRLSPAEADAARALHDFGNMIGNTDMHFGNLSLWADEPSSAKFSIAPVYDMLPMRWRADSFAGLHDYSAFEPPQRRMPSLPGEVSPRSVAQEFWAAAAKHAPLSRAFRDVAAEMARRLLPEATAS